MYYFNVFALLCFQVVVSVPHGEYRPNTQSFKTDEVYMQSPSFINNNLKHPIYLGEPTLNSPIKETTSRESSYQNQYQVPQDTLEYPLDSKSIGGLEVSGISPENLIINQQQHNQKIQLPESTWPQYNQGNTVPGLHRNANNLRPDAAVQEYQEERRIPTYFQNSVAVARSSVATENHYASVENIDKTGNSALDDVLPDPKKTEDVFVSTPHKKRYLIIHPDGTPEYFDEYAAAANKYPNHVLIRSKPPFNYKGDKQITPKNLILKNIPNVSTQMKSDETRSEAIFPHSLLDDKNNVQSSRVKKNEKQVSKELTNFFNQNGADLVSSLTTANQNVTLSKLPIAQFYPPNDVSSVNVTAISKSITIDQNLPLVNFQNVTKDIQLNQSYVSFINDKEIEELAIPADQNSTEDEITQLSEPNDVVLVNVTELSKFTTTDPNSPMLSFRNITNKKQLNQFNYLSILNSTETKEVATTTDDNFSIENNKEVEVSQLNDIKLVNVAEIVKSITKDQNLVQLSFRNATKNVQLDNFDYVTFLNNSEINDTASTLDKSLNIENNTFDEIKQLNPSGDIILINHTESSNNNLPDEEKTTPVDEFHDNLVNLNKSSVDNDVNDNTKIAAIKLDNLTINFNTEANDTNTTDEQTPQITDEKTIIGTTPNQKHEIKIPDTENEAEVVFPSDKEVSTLDPSLEIKDERMKCFWNQTAENNDDSNKTIFFITVPAVPKLSKETRTTIYPNGSIIEEVTETIQNEDNRPPIITVSKIIYPQGTYKFT